MDGNAYRQLEVWQVAMDLAEKVYAAVISFPDYEKYALANQLRRASVSIPSNIAEGYGRTHRAEYLQHLSIARGSLMEVETQLTLAVRLGHLTRDEAIPVWDLAQSVGRMLTRLIQSLNE